MGKSWTGIGLGLGGAPLLRRGPHIATRFSGPKLWTPASITTAAWYDAADSSTITLNGSTVSQWDDKSGNNRHATQPTASRQPNYVTSDALLNGKPSVKVPTDVGIIGLTVPEISYREVVCVGYYGDGTETAATNINTIFSGPGDFNAERVIVLNGQSVMLAHSVGTNFTGTVFKNGNTVGTNVLLPLPATVMRFRRDPGTDVTQTTNLQHSPLFTGRNFRGGIGEWIFLNADLTTEDRQKLEGYLAWKWGLEANLPSGHPYETAPPTV